MWSVSSILMLPNLGDLSVPELCNDCQLRTNALEGIVCGYALWEPYCGGAKWFNAGTPLIFIIAPCFNEICTTIQELFAKSTRRRKLRCVYEILEVCC